MSDRDDDLPLTEAELASLEQRSPLAPALAALTADVRGASPGRDERQDHDRAWARLEAALGPVADDDHPFAANETSGIRPSQGDGDVRPARQAAGGVASLDARRRAAATAPTSPGVAKTGRAMTWGAVALAAAAAFALYAKRREVIPAPSVTAKSYPPIVEIGDGGVTRTLAVGEVIKVPLDKTRWIAANGRVRVRVGADSVVRVLENGERILLALDHGVLGADVTPVPGGEPLAIDVGRHRLAVHGTKFQVQRAEEAIDVAVTEGVVVWGWPKGDRTQGVEIKAGQIGNFVWDTGGVLNDSISAKTKVDAALRVEPATLPTLAPGSVGSTSSSALSLLAPLPHPGAPPPPNTFAPEPPKPAPVPTGSTPAPEVSSTVAAPPAVPPPAGLSDAQANPVLAKLQKGLEACLVGGADGPKFTIETTMTVSVGKSGAIDGWTFDPPLDPTLRECARKKTVGVTFPTADGPSTLKRSIVLGKK